MTKRLALVTGGTGGIGTAVCRQLYIQGHDVVAGYHPSEHEPALAWREARGADGHDIGIISGDVSSFEDAGRMVSEVEEQHGPIDVLINCAGITRDKTLRKMTREQWYAVINTNLNSVFNVTRHVIEGMCERNYGRIVTISSVNGQKGQMGQTNYSAAKAGVHGFTMALAQEVARRGVTVNSVSPGYVTTRMTDAIPDDIRTGIIAQIPVGRMGEPDDVATAISFLVSDEAAYITGANVPVNGGLYMS